GGGGQEGATWRAWRTARGPAPRPSPEGGSPRGGPARPSHQGADRVDPPRRIVRARRRFRVILNTERTGVEQPDSLHHPVVQVDMTDLGPAERGVEGREGHRAGLPGAGGRD